MISYKIPPKLDTEIDDLDMLIRKFSKGEISSIELKARRVPFGIYEQRESDTYMVRIRCASGIIIPDQLAKVALLASKYGAKQIHLTTRQELQIHYVKMENLISVVKELKKIGLASRGGGGNTVRNITAPEDAGIDPDEKFDVTPYVISLTNRLISEDDSWTLPRKYKIAFSGSSKDKGYATIADIGFIAEIKNFQKGFRVYVAGGLGAKSKAGNLLFDFIGHDEVYLVTKAGKTLFWKYGNRKNKHAARLRFLWQSLGQEEFKKRFMQECEALKKEKCLPLEVVDIDNETIASDIPREDDNDSSDFELWRKRFVRPQKQKGAFSVMIPVELGFIDNQKVIKLAQFLKPFGENTIRMTKDQNFLVRNIGEKYLVNVYNFLKGLTENFNRPFVFDKIISCAGASTCQLGFCMSRGAARAIMKKLDKSNLDLDKLSDIKLNISGCPNSCGQHPVADLGFFGKADRKDGQLYPAYNVVCGADISDGNTKLAQKAGNVSAKDLPKVIEEILGAYLSDSKGYSNFKEYIRNSGKDNLVQICSKFSTPPNFGEDKNYYFDWESDDLFSLAERKSGECSAGIFDLIEVDQKNIEQTKEKILCVSDKEEKQELLADLVFYSCRMLLITRAIEPKTKDEVYDSFCEHFIETGLVNLYFKDIVEAVENNNFGFLSEKEDVVWVLAERVESLYENMDNSFQFKVPNAPELKEASKQTSTKIETQMPKSVKDFRGVACPMNFVKTKMELSLLKPKEILEVWLDDGEPIENVPGSVKQEGHKILKQEKKQDYWSVVIERK